MSNQPELKTDKDGNKWWKLNGYLHREDGPAIEILDGTKYWYINGRRHRVDGPAIQTPRGSKLWYINGNQYDSKEEWFKNLTPEQQYNYLWSLADE